MMAARRFTSTGSSVIVPALLVALLAGCGGGGGSASLAPDVELDVSTTQINVSTDAGTVAPTAMIYASIISSTSGSIQIFLKSKFTTNGIVAVTDANSNGIFSIQFKDPSTLNPGTYNDVVTIEACLNQACTSQIKNSPQQVSVVYTVTPSQPVLNGLQPALTTVGGGSFTVTVTGQYLTTQSVVQWNGVGLATTFVSNSELTAVVPSSDITAIGNFAVTVVNGALSSGSAPFAVQALVTPTISSLSPNTATAGGAAFTLAVSGANFTNQSTVNWGGSSRATGYLSAAQLTAQISSADLVAASTVGVTVSTLGANSNSLGFVIQPPGTVSVTSVQPASVSAGGPAFQLTVEGTGFVAGSTVLWNGSSRATTFVSTGVVTAQILASDIATAGSALIKVQNPANAGGTSPDGVTVTIERAGIDAVALQINAAHSGAISFQNASLPSASLWSVNLGGPPSFALIAQGLVYVMVVPTNSNGLTQLIALKQATGAIVWGPIEIAGPASAAYDNGMIFVVSNGASVGTMQAYNATTGASLWSTRLSGQFYFTSGVTALNGYAYTGGAESGGTLYAVAESSGTIAWTAVVENGDDSTPAVTADGVYVSYPCRAYDFSPASGSSVWAANPGGCEGGGGATPVVANGLLYFASGSSAGFSGQTLDAESGNPVGTFTGDNVPAIGATNGYFLQSGTLHGLRLSDNAALWSFAGDGNLVSSPLLVNNYVFVGSSAGKLYALDATSGTLLWQQNLGAAIPAGPAYYTSIPLSGLSAGDGLLVVPSGNTVTAYQLSANP